MKKIILLILCAGSLGVFAQSKKNKHKKDDAIAVDSVQMLKELIPSTCLCVDSISLNNRSQAEIAADISSCIQKSSRSYDLLMTLTNSLNDSKNSKKKNITISFDPESTDHSPSYFVLERMMRDSCPSLIRAAASNNKESKFSMSSDEFARNLFFKGEEAEKKEDYASAAKYFQEAVTRDEKFSFAWDNLGISLRKLGKYNEAIDAYNRSLALDPTGLTPLQNLPIVYQYLKDYDKALECYNNLIRIYPEDAEGYYGAAQAIVNGKKDFEKALDYMCKAYNIYINTGSPYRVDAEKTISYYYAELKKLGKEETFNKILNDNHIVSEKK